MILTILLPTDQGGAPFALLAQSVERRTRIDPAMRRPTVQIREGHFFLGGTIHVCLDNTSVILGLRGDPPTISQEAFLDFQAMAAIYDVRVHWVPGHQGIPGNEEADRLAKEGSKLPVPPGQPATAAAVKRLARARAEGLFQAWWEKEAKRPARYTRLGLEASLRCPRELKLPRRTLHHLLAARSGHGDFTEYHVRFGHEDAALQCSCGRDKTEEHLVFCRKSRRLEHRWPALKPRPRGLMEYWEKLLDSPKQFEASLETAQFFTETCPRPYRPRSGA